MKPIILGSGLAGLTAALTLAPMPVILVSPRTLGKGCSSAWAQGGIAAAMGDDDSPYIHTKDTLAVGCGLNNRAIVQQTVEDGPAVIKRLASYGVIFDRDDHNILSLALEAAHKKRRIVHVRDATGAAVMRALVAAVRVTPSIEIIENAHAQSLIVEDGIRGVSLKQEDQELVLSSNCIVLATGGAASLWRDTTNPHENKGWGLALAARAGATLSDLEFMQFHPTAIDIGRDPMPLASEALRGEGAILINEKGQRFIDELQPRDIVARAIWAQITQGHRIFLDASQAIGAKFSIRFPTIHALCMSAHIDPLITPIPIRPAAHYHMGGILTDAQGRSDVKGLWACGEVACTGLHGANRLASNSLLEAASFGHRVAEDIKNMLHKNSRISSSRPRWPHTRPEANSVDSQKIRATMADYVGVTRNSTGLKHALSFLLPLANSSTMALIGSMIATSALKREESRGAHYRTDYPQTLSVGHRSFLRLSDMETIS